MAVRKKKHVRHAVGMTNMRFIQKCHYNPSTGIKIIRSEDKYINIIALSDRYKKHRFPSTTSKVGYANRNCSRAVSKVQQVV
jgi:hypothetical protein